MRKYYVGENGLYCKDNSTIICRDGKLYCYDSSDPEDWITMNGSHVLLGSNGEIIGGAGGKFNGKAYTGTQKAKHVKSGTTSTQGVGMKSVSQHKEELKNEIKSELKKNGESDDDNAVFGHLVAGGAGSLGNLEHDYYSAKRSYEADKNDSQMAEYSRQKLEKAEGRMKAAESIANEYLDKRLQAIKTAAPNQYEEAKRQAENLKYDYGIGRVRSIPTSESDSQQKKDFAKAVENGDIRIVGNQIGGKTFNHKDFIKSEYGAKWDRDNERWIATKNIQQNN